MTNKDNLYKSFIFYFFLYFIIISVIFAFCFIEAYGFEEGTIKTDTAKMKYEILGYITLTAQIIGNNTFQGSQAFGAIFLPFSIFIDTFILSISTMLIVRLLAFFKIQIRKSD